MYECETWNTKEEPTLRVFKKKVCTKLFEPKRKAGTVGWANRRNEESRSLYSWPDIMVIKTVDEMGGTCNINSRDKMCLHYFSRKT